MDVSACPRASRPLPVQRRYHFCRWFTRRGQFTLSLKVPGLGSSGLDLTQSSHAFGGRGDGSNWPFSEATAASRGNRYRTTFRRYWRVRLNWPAARRQVVTASCDGCRGTGRDARSRTYGTMRGKAWNGPGAKPRGVSESLTPR
jgi:hypothetical protein